MPLGILRSNINPVCTVMFRRSCSASLSVVVLSFGLPMYPTDIFPVISPSAYSTTFECTYRVVRLDADVLRVHIRLHSFRVVPLVSPALLRNALSEVIHNNLYFLSYVTVTLSELSLYL